MPDAAAKLDAFWTVNVESQPYHLGLAMAWPMVNPSMIEAYRSERTDLARLHPALPQWGAFFIFFVGMSCHFAAGCNFDSGHEYPWIAALQANP